MAVYRHRNIDGLILQIDPELRIVEGLLVEPDKDSWRSKKQTDVIWKLRLKGVPISKFAFREHYQLMYYDEAARTYLDCRQ